VNGEITALYRFWSTSGLLLYVGITKDPPKRLSQHKGDKPWWTEVATVTIENYGSREEASAAERAAIRSEEPLYNVALYDGSHSWWDYLVVRAPELLAIEVATAADVRAGGCMERVLDRARMALRSAVGPGRGTSRRKGHADIADALEAWIDQTEATVGYTLEADESVLRSDLAFEMAWDRITRAVPVCGHDIPCDDCFPDELQGWDPRRYPHHCPRKAFA
jgi:hypothetical protein